MPVSRVGTAQIVIHAEIRRMSSFWRTDTSVRLVCSTLAAGYPCSRPLHQVQQVGAPVAEKTPGALARWASVRRCQAVKHLGQRDHARRYSQHLPGEPIDARSVGRG